MSVPDGKDCGDLGGGGVESMCGEVKGEERVLVVYCHLHPVAALLSPRCHYTFPPFPLPGALAAFHPRPASPFNSQIASCASVPLPSMLDFSLMGGGGCPVLSSATTNVVWWGHVLIICDETLSLRKGPYVASHASWDCIVKRVRRVLWPPQPVSDLCHTSACASLPFKMLLIARSSILRFFMNMLLPEKALIRLSAPHMLNEASNLAVPGPAPLPPSHSKVCH